MRELSGAWRHTSDVRSYVRLSVDVLLFRLLYILPGIAAKQRFRTVKLDGATITYRLNRGDIQGIREVWFEEAYLVPFGPIPRTVLDLGANIGLTSVWLQKRYGCERVVGVEPDPSNARLARINFHANDVPGQIIEAATGPVEGTACFAIGSASNVGAVVTPAPDRETLDVDVLPPASIMSSLGLTSIDLCKLDIEGGEGPLLLSGDRSWLDAVGSIMAELHEEAVDVAAVTASIEQAGLRYYVAGVDGRKTAFFAR